MAIRYKLINPIAKRNKLKEDAALAAEPPEDFEPVASGSDSDGGFDRHRIASHRIASHRIASHRLWTRPFRPPLNRLAPPVALACSACLRLKTKAPVATA